MSTHTATPTEEQRESLNALRQQIVEAEAKHDFTSAARLKGEWLDALKALHTPAPVVTDEQRRHMEALREQIEAAENRGAWSTSVALKGQLARFQRTLGLVP